MPPPLAGGLRFSALNTGRKQRFEVRTSVHEWIKIYEAPYLLTSPGARRRAKAAANRKLPVGITTLEHGSDIWAGFFTWGNIPGWRWRMKTSKSKYRSAAAFDLTKYDLLFPLLDAVPHENPMGAVIKGEKNLPVRQGPYGRWWR